MWFLPSFFNTLLLFFLGTYWNNVVPRGTASATKWAFVLASAAPTKEGWWGDSAWVGTVICLWPSWDRGVAVWTSDTRWGVTGWCPLLADQRDLKLGGLDQKRRVQK